MNVHLLQHLAYYVSRRGPLWAYSCFAFESMNAFIKPLVHGTHQAMEQIGCAIGLCFGLSNFTKKILQHNDIPRDSNMLLQSLTGYSKSSNKVSAKVHGGYLSGKERRKLIDNNILTLVRIFVMANKLPAYYELEPYCRFESDDGQKFFSLGTKTRKTDSTVIEYFDRNNTLCYGRVTHFLKIQDFGLCVVNELEENSEPLLFFNERDCIETLQSLTDDKQNKDIVRDILRKYRNRCLLKHHVHIKPRSGRAFVISVQQIRRKCVFIDILPNNALMISRFPNVNEHN